MNTQHSSDPRFRAGYQQGDSERQWLAIANSDLRSDILALTQKFDDLRILADMLNTYSTHRYRCAWMQEGDDCTCGYAGVSAKYDEFMSRSA